MGGKIFFGVLSLVALLAIAALLLRPATVIGVSDTALAYSLRGALEGSETGDCEGGDERFACTAFGDPQAGASSGPRAVYAVTTDDYGCWDAVLREGGTSGLPKSAEGCITVVDLLRLDD